MLNKRLWNLLAEKLNILASRSNDLQIWLRDDDIRHSSENFNKICNLIQTEDIPAALSVIPKLLEKSVVIKVNNLSDVMVFQHGFDHKNYNGLLDKCELVPLEKNSKLINNLLKGKERLQNHFGEKFIPVIVPPWNRIDGSVKKILAPLGFRGISTFSSVSTKISCSLLQLNPQVDIIDWSKGDCFAGEEYCLKQVISFIDSYLFDTIYPQPLGIITHHRTMGDGGFRFIKKFFKFIKQWPNLKKLNIKVFFIEEH